MAKSLLDWQTCQRANSRKIIENLFSAVFTDFWLFDQLLLLGPEGATRPTRNWLRSGWRGAENNSIKLELNNGRIVNLKLSKGRKTRGAVAGAGGRTRYYLLDEWAADQDPHFRREFYQVLLPLMQEMGKTIFAISHDDHCILSTPTACWKCATGNLAS